MKKVLVTGGSGFIGTNLVDALLREGNVVVSLDRAKPLKDAHLPVWKQVDILDFGKLEAEILKFDPEIILHLAAVADLDGTTMAHYSANVQGTQNIVDIAKKVPSLKKVLFPP